MKPLAGMVQMKWDLAPKLRADLVCYAGLNLSGERRVVDIHVVSGRQGADVPTAELRSLAFIAPLGTRLILKTTEDDDWESQPWRCIRIMKGFSFKTQEGNYGVRIPDLEYLDKPDARRNDPDWQESYPIVEKLSEGTGWTFGREGDLKGKVRKITIDKVG